jgi:hypothetical protein
MTMVSWLFFLIQWEILTHGAFSVGRCCIFVPRRARSNNKELVFVNSERRECAQGFFPSWSEAMDWCQIQVERGHV